ASRMPARPRPARRMPRGPTSASRMPRGPASARQAPSRPMLAGPMPVPPTPSRRVAPTGRSMPARETADRPTACCRAPGPSARALRRGGGCDGWDSCRREPPLIAPFGLTARDDTRVIQVGSERATMGRAVWNILGDGPLNTGVPAGTVQDSLYVLDDLTDEG